MILSIFLIVLAYLFGSISSAVVVSKLMGLPDPRTQGSKNPGATNVLRLGGKKAAIITLLGDFLKGLIPVLLAYLFGASDGAVALVGLAAFLGHLYPVFFGFVGGKGVATAAGVMFGWSVTLGLGVLVIWLAVAWVSKYSSLAALVAAALAPVLVLVFGVGISYFLVAVVIAVMLFWRHRENIGRLRNGSEGKINLKK